MQITVKINGVDFSHWAVQNGISITPVYRQQMSMVTINGLKHEIRREKTVIKIQLCEMRDETLAALLKEVADLSEVEYTDIRVGRTRYAKFYAKIGTVTAKRVAGGHTYVGGVTIELEEK